MAVLPPDPVFCLKSDMGHVHSLCFDESDGDCTGLLYASTELGYVYLWDLNTNRLKHSQKLGESIQVVHTLRNQLLLTQEKCGSLKVWQLHNGADMRLLRDHPFYGGFCKSKLIDRQSLLLLPQDRSTFELIDVNTFDTVQKFKTDDNFGSVMCLETLTLDNNRYILAGFETGHVVLYDLPTGKICSKLKLDECVTSVTFDSVTRRGVCGNVTNLIRIFTIGPDLRFSLKCEISVVNEGCTVVKIRPDRKIFVSGGVDARLRLYSWKSLRTLAVLAEHKKSITDVQFTPKIVQAHGAKLMLCSSADGAISLWNLYN